MSNEIVASQQGNKIPPLTRIYFVIHETSTGYSSRRCSAREAQDLAADESNLDQLPLCALIDDPTRSYYVHVDPDIMVSWQVNEIVVDSVGDHESIEV